MENGQPGLTDPEFRDSQPVSFNRHFAHQETLAALRDGIAARQGLIVVTGVPGAGKTTLLYKLVRELDKNVHYVFIAGPVASLTELLRLTLRNLGIAQQNETRLSMIHRLRSYLLEQFENGHIVALFIDDAQNQSDEMLEQIIGLMLLFEARDQGDKLLQLVLMGRRQLEKKLDGARLRPFKRHVALSCQLSRLRGRELNNYIDARIQGTGQTSNDLFQADAMAQLAVSSKGIPGLVNTICDHSLLKTGTTGRNKVSAQLIRSVVAELRLDKPPDSGTPSSLVDFEIPAEWAERSQFHLTDTAEKSPPGHEVFSSHNARIEAPGKSSGPKRRHRLSTTMAVLMMAGSISLVVFPLRLESYVERWRAKAGQFVESGRQYILQIRRDRGGTGKEAAVAIYPQGPAATENVSTQPDLENPDTDPLILPEKSRYPENSPSSNQTSVAQTPEESAITVPGTVTGGAPREVFEDPDGRRRRIVFKIHQGIQNRAISGIEVSLIDGTAYLDGRVASERQKRAAGLAAAIVPEVEHVENRIVVK